VELGALEIASVIESMNRNQYLPMPNLTAPISEKVIMKNKTFDCDIKYVIKNNFGFSGNNVSMVLKAGENK
jgi:3-oxoacyl-(acyl-carrier-protein) synthase